MNYKSVNHKLLSKKLMVKNQLKSYIDLPEVFLVEQLNSLQCVKRNAEHGIRGSVWL
jgi:hypothetical protein